MMKTLVFAFAFSALVAVARCQDFDGGFDGFEGFDGGNFGPQDNSGFDSSFDGFSAEGGAGDFGGADFGGSQFNGAQFNAAQFGGEDGQNFANFGDN